MYRTRKLAEALDLVSLGKAHGYLTAAELNHWLESMTPKQELLQQIHTALSDLNIKIIDGERMPEDETYDICKDITQEIALALIRLYTAWGECLTKYLSTDTQKTIFRLRLGIADGKTHSQEELAEEYSLTTKQIAYIERKACRHGLLPGRTRRLKESLD